MDKKISNKIEANITEKVISLGFEIEYVEVVKEADRNIVRIVIDKPGSSIFIDDCETVSRGIEDIVDKIYDKEYILEVTSPGLERELKNIKLYKKYIGSEIYVKLYKKLNNNKEITGILELVDENNNIIVIEVNGEKIELNLSDISSGHTVYDFSKDFSSRDNVNINKLNKVKNK